MHNILLEIIEKKREDLEESKKNLNFNSSLRGGTTKQSLRRSPRGVYPAFCGVRDDGFILIAEIKFVSPTNPHLGSPSELLERVKAYEQAGADAISVITEKHFFKGDPSFVTQVKQTVALPVLQKDFVIDACQIYQARAIGSDALLLIARLVDGETLKQFVVLCQELGIEPVVEVNNEEDLEKAIATETNIIAVNARDLETFHVDVARACRLMEQIPEKFIKLGFSGVTSSDEVLQYKEAGAKGVLVGTSLMKAENIKGFVTSLRANAESAAIPNEIASSQAPRNDESVKVKICGIRTTEAALTAVASGADFLGFNFVPSSKRRITVEVAKEIIAAVKGKVQTVGVFQNAAVDVVNEIADLLDLDFVQLHGEEDKEYIKKINRKVIKKIALDSSTPPSFAQNDNIKYYLLDRDIQGQGEMVDLEKAREIAETFPTFFSGGLTPENVSAIVKQVQLFAVDVAGGVETDGKEDGEKIKRFIHNAKEKVSSYATRRVAE